MRRCCALRPCANTSHPAVRCCPAFCPEWSAAPATNSSPVMKVLNPVMLCLRLHPFAVCARQHQQAAVLPHQLQRVNHLNLFTTHHIGNAMRCIPPGLRHCAHARHDGGGNAVCNFQPQQLAAQRAKACRARAVGGFLPAWRLPTAYPSRHISGCSANQSPKCLLKAAAKPSGATCKNALRQAFAVQCFLARR